MVNLVTCLFSLFEALNDAFEVHFFSGLHFYTLPETLIACRATQLRFFKVKTLLNNAFNSKLRYSELLSYFQVITGTSVKCGFHGARERFAKDANVEKWQSPTVVFYAAKDRQTIAGVRKRRQLLVGVVFSSAGISKK